jgi:16S rRNA (guanine966-N2)-methyltransferase
MTKRRQRGPGGLRGGAPGRLRIVAGNWRGRRLPVVDADGLRPTAERVRETLFNWLMHTIAGKRCLDLFAGTGALGLEALSRGARSCIFVERDRRAARALRENVRTLDAAGAEVIEADAQRVIDTLEPGRVDLVFLDPPFADADLTRLCRRLVESGILAPDARVYLEMPRDAADIELPDGWRRIKTGNAGNVSFALVATGQE